MYRDGRQTELLEKFYETFQIPTFSPNRQSVDGDCPEFYTAKGKFQCELSLLKMLQVAEGWEFSSILLHTFFIVYVNGKIRIIMVWPLAGCKGCFTLLENGTGFQTQGVPSYLRRQIIAHARNTSTFYICIKKVPPSITSFPKDFSRAELGKTLGSHCKSGVGSAGVDSNRSEQIYGSFICLMPSYVQWQEK